MNLDAVREGTNPIQSTERSRPVVFGLLAISLLAFWALVICALLQIV